MSARPLNPAGLDWAASWRKKHEVRAAHAVGQRDWDSRAGRFARPAEIGRDPLLQRLAGVLGKGDSVLDVGAGAGRYSLPIATLAGRVTAVEPSAGMRAALESSLSEHSVQNVSVVPGTWQDAFVEQHDVVVCPHVVYFVADIVQFIEKLDGAARRSVYIYLRVDGRETPFRPIWDELFGTPFPSEPGFLDLYSLLFSMGIRPQVELATDPSAGYATMDEALTQARDQLGIHSDEHDLRLRELLTKHLIPEDGRLRSPSVAQSAILWWSR